MITLNFDWREVLWWMQGGMLGSHIRWNVYKDMVNKVWPQCSEQERMNLWYIMRRDLGDSWRPGGWCGYGEAHGEGPWKCDKEGYVIDQKNADGHPLRIDVTPWMYFRQVLARFDPENQYAVRMAVHNQKELDSALCLTLQGIIIQRPNLSYFDKDEEWESDTTNVTVRTYRWQDSYYIDWSRRCDHDRITKVEKLEIPDNGTM